AKVEVWDIPTARQVAVLDPGKPDGSLRAVSFRAGGRELLTTAHDGTIQVWDAETGKQRHVLSGTRPGGMNAAYSADGRRIAAWAENEVQLHDADSASWLWGRSQNEPVDGVA